MPIVFFDLETGGLKPDQHPVIQLAAIAVGAGWREIEVLERKVRFDESKADPEALRLNHFYERREAWAEAVSERVVVTEFADLLERHRCIVRISRAGNPWRCTPLGGHNISFDLEHVLAMFKRYGGPKGTFFCGDMSGPLDTRFGAVWALAGRPQPENYTLAGLAKHFGIPVDGAHDALVDVRLSIEIAKRLRDPELLLGAA